MKSLKFNHTAAGRLAAGPDNITWRINDDKMLRVGDDFECVDKLQANRPDTWQTIGKGTISRVDEKRLGDLTDDELTALTAESRAALLAVSRQYYGDAVADDTPVKLVHFNFSPYEQPRSHQAPLPQYKELQLFADGGSRGNPGPSASGFVLLDMQDAVITKSGLYLGVTTNNQAEYQAVRLGLEAAEKYGAQDVHVFLDSLLVVNQMKGIFKVKNRDLWPVHEALKSYVAQFKKVTFTHVPRELNKLADAAVNETLDAVLHE